MNKLTEVIDGMLEEKLTDWPIKFSDPLRTEKIIESRWEHAVLFAIAEAPEEADAAVRQFLRTVPDREPNRARAIFALRCLSEGAMVTPRTAAQVFEGAIRHLEETDGMGANRETYMDRAIRAVLHSRWGDACRDHFLEACVQTSDEIVRLRIARSLANHRAFATYDAENASELMCDVPDLLWRVKDGPAKDRLAATLGLLERFYEFSNKRFGPRGATLPPPLRMETTRVLLAAANESGTNAAVALGATWALGWLAEARSTNAQRDFGSAKSKTTAPAPEDDWIWTEDERSAFRLLMNDTGRDEFLRSWAALLLSSRLGKKLVPEQCDWIYKIACMADGAIAVRELPCPQTVALPGNETELRLFLTTARAYHTRCHSAISLGRLGCYLPEMVSPLLKGFQDRSAPTDQRDEALLYLIFIYRKLTGAEDGGSRAFFLLPKVIHSAIKRGKLSVARDIRTILLQGASLPEEEENYDFRSRCMFAILVLGDVDLIDGQLKPGIAHPDAYAYALAGMSDSRGTRRLNALRSHSNPAIKAAVEKAMEAERRWNAGK